MAWRKPENCERCAYISRKILKWVPFSAKMTLTIGRGFSAQAADPSKPNLSTPGRKGTLSGPQIRVVTFPLSTLPPRKCLSTQQWRKLVSWESMVNRLSEAIPFIFVQPLPYIHIPSSFTHPLYSSHSPHTTNTLHKISYKFDLRLTKGSGYHLLAEFFPVALRSKRNDLSHLGDLSDILRSHFDEKLATWENWKSPFSKHLLVWSWTYCVC